MPSNDPVLAVARYRAHARDYDATARRSAPIRARAIELLRLAPGATVLDVACGTGLSLPALAAAVGPQGQVIGIDLSPDMLAAAQERVVRAGWHNVTLIETAAEQVQLDQRLDAVLFNYTHDVLQSAAALQRVFAATRAGARVAAAGLKYYPWWLAPLNPWVRMRARPYAVTLDGLDRPWEPLATYLDELTLESRNWGSGYICSGTVRRA